MAANTSNNDNTAEGNVITFHPSWFNYLQHFLFIIIATSIAVFGFIKEFLIYDYDVLDYISYFLLIILIIVLIATALERSSQTYIVTPNVVRSKIGILSLTEKEIRISDIREIVINQCIFQRILKIGDLSFSSASTNLVELSFKGVKDPMKIKDKVNAKRDAN
ncbi:MAG: hypothetical protein CVT90_02445 [Candidatus Altiarchaeales archaeon HGW-Altiarchaeales-3]|nr:MAG: hypothetical protein CVT90_02445 [Candidatus Altiarchaeales archaeon HGW-Altiarchaeales-3]